MNIIERILEINKGTEGWVLFTHTVSNNRTQGIYVINAWLIFTEPIFLIHDQIIFFSKIVESGIDETRIQFVHTWQ